MYSELMAKLDPIVSEFETDEDAAAYDAWFRAQVESALASTKARIPHEQVVAAIRELLARKRKALSSPAS